MTDPFILILRDPRESAKKCSLTPLRGLPGIEFVPYYKGHNVNAEGRILLDPDGAEFTPADRGKQLFLIDCSWRRLPQLNEVVEGQLERRRLPAFVTAYPRVSRIFQDPDAGLASVEALFAATVMLGAPRLDLLDAYHWRDAFLQANAELLGEYGFDLNAPR